VSLLFMLHNCFEFGLRSELPSAMLNLMLEVSLISTQFEAHGMPQSKVLPFLFFS
jgi:hypothetical protein